jgi:hypothetical protein
MHPTDNIWADWSDQLGLAFLNAPVEALWLALGWSAIVSLVAFVLMGRAHRKNRALKQDITNLREKLVEARHRYETTWLRRMNGNQLQLPLMKDSPELGPTLEQQAETGKPKTSVATHLGRSRDDA